MKNFRIWLGWAYYKFIFLRAVLTSCSLVYLLAAYVYIRSFPLTAKAISIGLPLLILSLFLVFCEVACLGLKNENKNFRIAIDEAEEFKLKHEDSTEKLTELVEQTKRKKDPTLINQWIKNYTELIYKRKELEYLEQKETELPNQIKETRKKIKALEAKN